MTRRTVTGAVLDLDVEENDDHDEDVAASDPDRFLYFPFYLDVEPTTPGADPAGVVAAVAALLGGLAEAGAECVTAADYEDQLPGGGRTGSSTGGPGSVTDPYRLTSEPDLRGWAR